MNKGGLEDKENHFNAVICDVLTLFQIITVSSNKFEDLQNGIVAEGLFIPILYVRAIVHTLPPILLASVAIPFFLSNWTSLHIRIARLCYIVL